MTLQEAQECVKNTKYIVWSKDESIQLQKKLFEIGCRWLITGQSGYITEGPFLFVNDQLLITYVAKDRSEWFDGSQNTVKSAQDVLSIEIEQPEEEQKQEEHKDSQMVPGEVYELPQGYEFRDKEGNLIDTTTIVLLQKKPQLPSSLPTVCDTLGIKIPVNERDWGYNDPLFGEMTPAIVAYKQLLLCREAFYKVIGGEKPYCPDWDDVQEKKYCVVFDGDRIRVIISTTRQRPFAFPEYQYAEYFAKYFPVLFNKAKKVL